MCSKYTETVSFNLYYCIEHLASDLQRCHYGDTECLKSIIPEYIQKLKNGRRDLNFVPLDPLQVDEVNIVQGAQSPVNINLKFRDMQCYGLSSAKILKVV